jgi:membrane-bound lytic murein transglycosylase D
MMRTALVAAVAVGGLLCTTPQVLAENTPAQSNPFPEPAALEPDIHFWARIYSEVGTTGGLLHDTRDLAVVYEVVDLPSNKRSGRARQRYTDKRKKVYRQILNTLGRGKRTNLSGEEARVLALFPEGVSNKTLRESARRVRFQLGQADKFRAGVIRSGAYLPHIEKTLADMGLPNDIKALPHVESSYTPHAYSRVGAAGLWQFTRSTGRRYMRVDGVVDERMDPYRASVAAARLLQQNRRVTGAWPLAITAYNHGASGMRRAVRKLGTRDITTIVRKYRSRTFGFASRNFYVEFLAARRVSSDHERYFGKLVLDTPIDYDTAVVPFYTTPSALSKATGVDLATFKEANPALRPSVYRGQKRVPKGFEIHLPRAVLSRPIMTAINEVPGPARYTKQTRDTVHVVRRGETLSTIARRYGVRMSTLQELNGLRSRNRIRVGQKLRLPSTTQSGRQIAQSKPPKRSAPPANGLYTVRRGDSIYKIAARFGMTESDLLAANDLRNANRIYPGQELRVSTAVDDAIVKGPAPAEPQPGAKQAPAAQPPAPADPHPQALAVMTPSRSTVSEPEVEAPPEIVDDPEPDADGTIVSVAAEAGDAPDAPETQPNTLVADPSNYSVASDGTVEVQATETLGHYAEWLGIRASRLRSINHMRYGEPITVHSQIKLDFSDVTPAVFEERRLEYHRAMQENFFSEWEIAGTEIHKMRRGDSLWVLTHRKFNVPLWLLRQYNPDLDFEALNAGTSITVPLLKRRDFDAGLQSARNGQQPPMS